ncbi:MAG: SoxR reducing system RseC family protein [Prevotella sp.]|nr:SoxR reducing system RseC family protein [Prevotella sp.]
MSNTISHSGVVESIDGRLVRVRILQTSACAACKVAARCNASESKEKTIEVDTPAAASYSVGQQVVVSTTGSMAAKALLWGFGMPFVVMVAVTVAVMLLTANEALAALCGLAALAPYYIGVWLMRDRLKEQLAFYIE